MNLVGVLWGLTKHLSLQLVRPVGWLLNLADLDCPVVTQWTPSDSIVPAWNREHGFIVSILLKCSSVDE